MDQWSQEWHWQTLYTELLFQAGSGDSAGGVMGLWEAWWIALLAMQVLSYSRITLIQHRSTRPPSPCIVAYSSYVPIQKCQLYIAKHVSHIWPTRKHVHVCMYNIRWCICAYVSLYLFLFTHASASIVYKYIDTCMCVSVHAPSPLHISMHGWTRSNGYDRSMSTFTLCIYIYNMMFMICRMRTCICVPMFHSCVRKYQLILTQANGKPHPIPNWCSGIGFHFYTLATSLPKNCTRKRIWMGLPENNSPL